MCASFGQVPACRPAHRDAVPLPTVTPSTHADRDACHPSNRDAATHSAVTPSGHPPVTGDETDIPGKRVTRHGREVGRRHGREGGRRHGGKGGGVTVGRVEGVTVGRW